jgi:hypothetical protein
VSSRIAVDWRSIKRWCIVGAFLMLGWLMLPVAKCSFEAFRDTPLSEAQPTADPNEPTAPPEAPGFFGKLGGAIKGCYRETPLLGQEDWKSFLLFGFAAGALIAGVVAHLEARRKRTFDE